LMRGDTGSRKENASKQEAARMYLVG
jgi:hypothetical protein